MVFRGIGFLAINVPRTSCNLVGRLDTTMKTTLHLHRPVDARGGATHHVRPSTMRLGLVLSLVAAVLAIVLSRPSCTCRRCSS